MKDCNEAKKRKKSEESEKEYKEVNLAMENFAMVAVDVSMEQAVVEQVPNKNAKIKEDQEMDLIDYEVCNLNL